MPKHQEPRPPQSAEQFRSASVGRGYFTRSMWLVRYCACIVSCIGISLLVNANLYAGGPFVLTVIDEKTGEEIAARMQLTDAGGRKVRIGTALQRGSWILLEKPLRIKLRPGDYFFEVTRGPEYRTLSGSFSLDGKSDGEATLALPRSVNLREESWYAGDLLASGTPVEIKRWMGAEDLTVSISESASTPSSSSPIPLRDSSDPEPALAPETAAANDSPVPATDLESETRSMTSADKPTTWVASGSFIHDTPSSGLVVHHWQPPGEIPNWMPSSRIIVEAKKQQEAHVEIFRPWAADMPIWLASNRIDSIQILSEHLRPNDPNPFPAAMENPDSLRFQGNHAFGRIGEFLYWQVLEAGFSIPPSAGSGFGRGTNPLGYNRVYTHLDAAPTEESWWRALREGRTVVTNGPLLRPTVNGELPGAKFEIPQGQSLQVDVALTLTVGDPVDYLDVIFNGKTLYQARLDEYAKQNGQIPPLQINESGWMVVRCVTAHEPSYRIVTSAPYYFQSSGKHRISRSAVEFFQNWLERTAKNLPNDARTQAAAVPFVDAARKFWANRLAEATAP